MSITSARYTEATV